MVKNISVKAIVTVKLTAVGFLKNIGLGQGVDGISDLLYADALRLELVSSEVNNPKLGTTLDKEPIKADAKLKLNNHIHNHNHNHNHKQKEIKYEAKLHVSENIGEVGAILVTNEHHKELYLEDIILEGLPQGVVEFVCKSWVHSKRDNPEKRIFFTNKAYLPSQTPSGLRSLREKELDNLRGNGEGERKAYDRIYDYDAYNDIGNPDENVDLLRPVLGSKKHPYPRRGRTGRSPSKADPSSEERVGSFYVPRDEDFSDLKEITFGINALDNILHALVPSVKAAIADSNAGFESFKEVLELFNEGVELSGLKNKAEIAKQMPDFFHQTKNVLQFPTPDLMDRDEFAWFRDEEFARETLARLNPYAVRLVTEWPLRSKLDPKVYGSPESAITSEMIEQEIKDIMSLSEALEQKKLFVLDYHDLLLPYVNKVRQIEGTTLYGSRTLFLLVPQGTLRPVAIELTRPPTDDGKPQWKQVFTPCRSLDGTKVWLWKHAKAHVLAHDSGYHQLISHWLRTHCSVEPYIIATNRQLSAMHPIHKLMKPYFRFTMMINALARQALINANGIIESSFSTERYSMEFSSAVYGQEWRFDQQGLPADLISRGMAVEDPSAPHGLKLAIEDYPFANDGLLLWDAIKQWVTDYVTHHYATKELVKSDTELQAWWEEIQTKGHPDIKEGWPKLDTQTDLIDILTSIIWVASGHHAAVNFGQYAYAGYFPNRPTIARINMPSEDPSEEQWNNFVKDPVDTLLQTFPSKIQATKVMAVLSVLSSHSPDEEYIGDQIEPSWAEDPNIKAAFERFNASLKNMEGVIDSRNEDAMLKNRNGAGTLPYQLLKPFSKSGMTAMGVPNSISI